eukprot:6147842-Pyramimonas_sp.AAC.1
MYMNTAPRFARPAALEQQLCNACSRNQRGFMHMYVHVSLLKYWRSARSPPLCGRRRPGHADVTAASSLLARLGLRTTSLLLDGAG